MLRKVRKLSGFWTFMFHDKCSETFKGELLQAANFRWDRPKKAGRDLTIIKVLLDTGVAALEVVMRVVWTFEIPASAEMLVHLGLPWY